MTPTSYTIIEEIEATDIKTVIYTDQDGFEYSIQVSLDADLDQIILGI